MDGLGTQRLHQGDHLPLAARAQGHVRVPLETLLSIPRGFRVPHQEQAHH
jgi:hypothetical protein